MDNFESVIFNGPGQPTRVENISSLHPAVSPITEDEMGERHGGPCSSFYPHWHYAYVGKIVTSRAVFFVYPGDTIVDHPTFGIIVIPSDEKCAYSPPVDRDVGATEVALVLKAGQSTISRYANGLVPSDKPPFPKPTRVGRKGRRFWKLGDIIKWRDTYVDLYNPEDLP